MRTNLSLVKKLIFSFLLSVLTTFGVQAQTCSQGTAIIVGGSHFETLYGEYNWNIGATLMIGPSGGVLSTPLPYSENGADFGARNAYVITDNPNKIHANFPDIDQNMMLISSTAAANTTMLTFDVSGLKAGSQYTVVVEGYLMRANNTCAPPGPNLQLAANIGTNGFPDQGNNGWAQSTSIAASKWETPFRVTSGTRTLAAGATAFTFHIMKPNDSSYGNCVVLGISKIEIRGCINPKVTSSEGNEVCRGEQIRLRLDREYPADNYVWQKSLNNVDWTGFGGNTRSVLDDEVLNTTWYRCTVDGTISETLRVTTVTCCEIKPGVPASRKTVYHENFGRFLSPRNYVNMLGEPYRTLGDWKTDLPYAIPNHRIQSPIADPPADGFYAISVMRDNILRWLGGGNLREDASGDPNGGVLMININNGIPSASLPLPIYSHTIDGLCPDVDLYFETSFADASGGGALNLAIRIETTTGGLLGSASVTSLGSSRWNRITIPPFKTTENSVVLKVVTMTNGSNSGADLLVDDIIFRICTPPLVEVYSDINNLTQNSTICGRYNVDLATQVSKLVDDYYDNVPRFLFQASTNGGTTWTNISGILDTPAYSHPLAAYPSESNVLFRILVGTAGLLNDFVLNPGFQDNTHCKTVSISDPIKIFIDCPCPTPLRVNIGANKSIVNKVITLCMNETVTLNVNPAISNVCSALWFQSATRPSAGATPLQTANSFNITATEEGTKRYFVKVIETDVPDYAQCWRFDSVDVKINPEPLTNIIQDACVENPLTPGANDNICFRFTSKYANGSFTGSSAASRFIPYRTITGNTRIGTDTIKVAAGETSPPAVCYTGTGIEFEERVGTDTLYHIYLEDVTLIPFQGTLLPGAGTSLTTTANNDNGNNNITPTRMLLEVTKEVKLESVIVYVQGVGGNRTMTVTPVIYPATGAADTPGAGTNIPGAADQSFTFGTSKTALNINLNNHTLAPGRYYLGFTFSLTSNFRVYSTTRATNGTNYIFTNRFEDNIVDGGLALYGIGSRQGTGTSSNYIIADLKFNTAMKYNDCGRIKLTSKYFCPPCARPEMQGGKRVDILSPGAKREGNSIYLCNRESVDLSVRTLVKADAGDEFDILWYQIANESAATPTNHLQMTTNAVTDTYSITAWANTTNEPITRRYYVKVQDSKDKSASGCWVWDYVDIVVNPTPFVDTQTTTTCSEVPFTVTPENGNNGNVVPAGTTYTWTVVPNSNISGLQNQTTPQQNISQRLFNTSSTVQTAVYNVIPQFGTATTGCSGSSFEVRVDVTPTPELSSDLTSSACSGVAFSYLATSETPSTTFSWTRAAEEGILPDTGSGNSATINETLTNITYNPITVTYIFSMSANGCTNTEEIEVTVNPKPVLSSTFTPPATCSAFIYQATSETSGTTFSWTRAAVAGIDEPAGSGNSANVNETLTNSTADPITVTYEFTLSANDCENIQEVLVVVNPTPVLSSTLTPPATCSEFKYTAQSATDGTAFSWTRAAVSGIEPPTGSGNSAIIDENLTNSTDAPIIVTYIITLEVEDCDNEQEVKVTVNPTPLLSSTLAPAAICTAKSFEYTATSATDDVNFSWERTAIANINGGAAGSGNSATISEVLTNSSENPIIVTYTFTLKIGDCTNSQEVKVTVNPVPALSSPAPAAICSGATFIYTATSGTTGAAFSWTRAAVNGINSETAGSGSSANINETLTNSTTNPIIVTYIFTLKIGDCEETYEVEVTVNPIPVFSSPLTIPATCSEVKYEAESETAGVSFGWTRAAVTGITEGAGSGSSAIIDEKLTNGTAASITVTYIFTMNFAGCTNSQNVTVTVDPTPLLSSSPPAAICSGATFNYTATSTTPGVTFGWTRAAVYGIEEAASSGNSATVGETLTNSTSLPIAVIYEFALTAGCTNKQNVTVTVNPKPAIELISDATTADQRRCKNNAIANITYQLKGGATGATVSGLPAGVTYNVSGGIVVISGTPTVTGGPFDYTVKTTGEITPCTAVTASGKIFIDDLPTITIVAEPTVCYGNTAELSIIPNSPSATVVWSDDRNTIISDNTGTTVTVLPPYIKVGNSYQSTYNYSVTVDDGCKATFPVPVNIDEPLSGNIVPSKTQACEGAIVTLDAKSYNAATYTWTSSAFTGEKYSANLTTDELKITTTYYLYVTRGTCDDNDAITIDVNSKPVIIAIDSVGARDREIVFAPEYGTQPFKFGVDNKDPDLNPVKYDLNFGLHSFRIIDAAGCSTEVLGYTVRPPALFLPPYFTPNGDGINDTWEIGDMRDVYPNAVITIYDRYGKQLIQYKGSDIGWDGTYLGKAMPTTDYWYVIDIDEINKQYIGHFTLIRE